MSNNEWKMSIFEIDNPENLTEKIYQADIIIDGVDYHSRGATIGKTLVDLGFFLLSKSDNLSE